ncbi:Heat shock cognate 71 kDa protein [Orchesella cincta]|uniref:Heat shock cognate 71 kDa protein n=1 Tax=Orchesella cincta TaxID=48709 RepID=A0A1D2ME21_ORCCI|nr:Heat shock cognate 71 kDa protein [Orchesella cincta]
MELLRLLYNPHESHDRILLDKLSLVAVLDQADSKPLSIISTVGHSSQNLSLVFEYIVRHLDSLENSNTNSASSDLPEATFKTLNFPDKDKMGTWILNKTFSIRKAAVILLYSQCKEDEFYLENTNMNTLAGLNFRMSSLTIMTSPENVISDCLLKVKTFTDVGTRGGGRSAFFQKLAILISESSVTSFGSEAGGISLDTYDKKTSDMLQEKFQNVNCYLIPSLLTSDCLDETSEHFDPSLLIVFENFVKKFINSEKIEVRKVKKKKLTTSDLVTLLEKYTSSDFCPGDIENGMGIEEATHTNSAVPEITKTNDKLKITSGFTPVSEVDSNTTKLPLEQNATQSHDDDEQVKNHRTEAKTDTPFQAGREKEENLDNCQNTTGELMEEVNKHSHAQKQSENDNAPLSHQPTNRRSVAQIIKDSLKIYKSLMKSETNQENVMYCSQSSIQDADKIASAKSTKALQESLKNDDNQTIENAVKKLKSQMKTELSIIEDENDMARQTFIEELIQDFTEKYTTSLITMDYTDERQFKKLSGKIRQKLLGEMEDILLENEDTDESPVQELQETLEKIEKKYLAVKIKEARETEELLETALDLAAVDYRKAMEKSIAEKPLRNCHLRNRKICLNELVQNFGPEWNSKFEERLDKKLESILSSLLRKQNDFENQSKSLIKRLQMEYQNQLKECKDHSDLKQKIFHEPLLTTVLAEHDENSPYNIGSELLKASNNELKKILEEYFASWQLKIHEENQLWNQVEARYENDMKKLLNEGPLTDGEFDRKNEEILKSNVKWHLGKLQELNINIHLDELYNSAKTRLSKLTSNFQAENSQNFELVALQAKQIFKEALDDYNSKMRQYIKQAQTPDELTDLHKLAYYEALKVLSTSQIIKTNPSFLPSCEQTLKEKTEASLNEIMELFSLRVKPRSGNFNDEATVLKLYEEEMEKHISSQEFIEAEVLERRHSDVSERILRNSISVPFEKKEQLRKTLNKSFIKYKNKNLEVSQQEPAIGIDLGTTYSCVAIYAKGKMHIIRNGIGNNTTPSYVAFQKDGSVITGNAAKEQAYTNPENTIFDAKRIIGRKFADPQLQEDIQFWPFDVVNDSGIPKISVNGEKLHPEEISAKLLAELKRDAEKYLKMKVKKAVITVPAYFTDGQRQATIDAGQMAGLDVISILNEPTAAALAYKLQQSSDVGPRHVLIFDLGGGTFDVAVMRTSKGRLDNLGVHGDTHLGGEDFDKNLMNYCARKFLEQHNIDIFQGKDSTNKQERDKVRKRLKRLQAECEKRKIDLATARVAEVSVDCLHGDIDLCVEITREKFDKLNATLFQKTIEIVDKALAASKISKAAIDDIVLVGGSSRILKIKELLQTYFNGKALNCYINADEAVAYGAAMQAAMLNSTIDENSNAHANIQDVTSMSIGMRTHGGGFSVIIPRNTEIPVKLKKKYKTAHDLQTYVYLEIFQGEDPLAVNNTHLGDFILDGIPPGEAESEEVQVEMFINKQGILNVKVVSTTTGASKVTVIEKKERMTKEAIQSYLRREENPLYQREVDRLV